jgi:stage II sporulation protein D
VKRVERPGQGWAKTGRPNGERRHRRDHGDRGVVKRKRTEKCPVRRVPDEPTLRLVRDLGGSASVPCLLPAPGFSPFRASARYDAGAAAVNPERGVLSHFRENFGSAGTSEDPAASVVVMDQRPRRPRRRTRWQPIVAVLLVMSACTASPPERPPTSGASPTPSVPSVPTTSPSSPSPQEDLGDPQASSVRLTAPPGGSFVLRGRFPFVPSPCRDAERPTLTGRFPGTLQVRRAEDGTLALTVTVRFDRYLEGIAEVPPSWPPAALEAQAIAARSYALATTGWSGREGEALDDPICATTSCQVYRGIPVPPDPAHRRWVRAVRRTDGMVLRDGDRPATTVYFSTSNGRTYPNEEVFGSSPLPYLRSVTERDDGASPTSRWRVRLPFDDLARFLRAQGLWPAGRSIARATASRGSVTVRGGGMSRSIDASDLRDAVNAWAPCLRPGRYPNRVAGTALPLTIPSRWLRLAVEGRAIVVTGRGWGHGVGMVQWGAYGKARRGMSASDILAFYYGGLRPVHHPEPGLIHVQIASGILSLRITPSAPGAKIDGAPFPSGPVVISGGSGGLDVRG